MGARDWQRPFHFTCAPTWSYGGAKMRFAKGNPAVQFTFTEPPYNKNTITGRLTVRNTADRPKTYKAVLRVPSDGMPEDTVEKTLDIAPGETSELTIDSGSIKISNVRYEFHIEVSDESGYLYRQGFNWRKPFNEPIWDVSDKPPLPFDFMFAFYPTGSKLRLTTVVRATKNVPENVTYAVREATSGKDVARVDVPAKDGVETWIQLPELDGDYVIGQIAGKTVEKKTFERHRFVWEGNSLGKSRKVYAPFTPIDVDGKVLKTVLREHSLGENGLPAQIKADGRDLMAAPIRLVANGKEVTASLSFVEKSDDRIITKSTLKGERFVGEAIATWEYDGCLKYELFLKEGTLNDLTLEIPFKNAEATCLHALGVMRATDTLRLPAREGVIWDTTHLKTLVLANFANYVFIGNAFRGLAYWAENDKGWGWDRSTANTDVVRKGEVVTARLHLVNKTTSINEPRRILLGFQAGPVQTRFSPEFVQMVSSGLIVGACPELLSDRGVPKVDKEFVARTYCAVPLVHGIPYGGNPKLAPWANYLRDDYCRNQKLDLHRYFDDGDPVVKVSDPDVKWCLYRIPDGKTAILFVSYADRPLTCTFEVADSFGLKGKKITDFDTKASGSYTLHFKRGYEIICLEFEPKRSN